MEERKSLLEICSEYVDNNLHIFNRETIITHADDRFNIKVYQYELNLLNFLFRLN